MNTTEMLKMIGESVGSAATVRSVFGEPIHAQGRTIVPIAKVTCGFGGGGGRGPLESTEGGGGGGGVRALPIGALEITQTGTRFVSLTDYRLSLLAFVAGVVAGGLWVGLKRNRHNRVAR